MNRTSISDLKLAAKDQLLGNYGIATGSFALLFVLVYSIMIVVTSAMTAGNTASAPAGRSILLDEILTTALSIAITAIGSILSTGYLFILSRISRGENPVTSDLFYVFKHHPDKVIIISVIMSCIQYILLIPSMIFQNGVYVGLGTPDMALNGQRFLTWIVLYVAAIIISLIIDSYLAMAYLIYLDDTDKGVIMIIKTSISMMKGNVLRYLYMIISFVGYYLLAVFSLGIALLWVFPYQMMTMVKFYNDLKEAV